MNALHSAIYSNDKVNVELLLQKCADVNFKDIVRYILYIYLYISFFLSSFLSFFLSFFISFFLSFFLSLFIYLFLYLHEYKSNHFIKDGKTPLHLAIEKQNIDIALLLLGNGADINANDKVPIF